MAKFERLSERQKLLNRYWKKVRDAQQRRLEAVWKQERGAIWFPPETDEAWLDFFAMPVVDYRRIMDRSRSIGIFHWINEKYPEHDHFNEFVWSEPGFYRFYHASAYPVPAPRALRRGVQRG